MKTEKIQKHMMRRTVVVGVYEDTNKIVGVLHYADIRGQRAGMAGHTPDDGNMYNGYYQFDYIRKATDDERAEFFAWLVSDGRDITDNFARFGGMPRGFEAWRAAQDARVEPVADEPTPEPVVTPQHKVGDLRIGLDHDGLAIVGRVRQIDLDGDIWIGGACCRPSARPLFEPTPENVARLVEQQRERGIVPELGDLVFVALPALATGLVAHNVSTAPDAKLLQGVMVGGGAFSWALAPTIAAHTLVIRRCSFREVDHG